nr:ecotin family protein [uncultured Porphyromonas sp.]
MDYRSQPFVLTLMALLLVVAGSCRTTREGQEDKLDSIPEQKLSYDEPRAALPEGMHLVRLRDLSPKDDYRLELIPLVRNEHPAGLYRLEGRLVSSDPWQGINHYSYEGASQPICCTQSPNAPETFRRYALGEPLLLPLLGNQQLVLEPRDSVAIGLRYWKAVGAATELKPSAELERRAPKEGYRAYEFTAPRPRHEDDPEEYYIELIPSKRMKVDCNIHLLRGRFELERDGTPDHLSYTFLSDGSTMSTRMGCPDGTLTEKLIRHTGLIVLRWAGSGLQIYVPEGFVMRYRLYRPDGQLSPVTPLPKSKPQPKH